MDNINKALNNKKLIIKSPATAPKIDVRRKTPGQSCNLNPLCSI